MHPTNHAPTAPAGLVITHLPTSRWPQGAISLQVGLMTGALWGLQRACEALPSLPLPEGTSDADVAQVWT